MLSGTAGSVFGVGKLSAAIVLTVGKRTARLRKTLKDDQTHVMIFSFLFATSYLLFFP